MSNVSSSYIQHEFLLTPSLSCFVTNVAPLPDSSFPDMKDLLLQNEKLMLAQEEKVQILVAICASLLAITEKATLLQAAGVPSSDTATITEAATSSSEGLGTSTGGITPQGPRTFVGALAPSTHQITLDFLHP